MAFAALKSGILVPSRLKPDKGPVAGEDRLRLRSFADTTSPADGLTPERLVGILRDARGGDIVEQAKTFRDMEERDGIIGAHMATRRAGVMSCGWQIMPDPDAEDEEAAQAAADLCKAAADGLDGEVEGKDAGDGVLLRGGFDDVLRMLLDAIGKGFACVEPIWDSSEKQWWWKSAEWRPQHWFQLGTPGLSDPNIPAHELRLRNGTVNGERINPLNLWAHVHRAKAGGPAETALFRQLARPFVIRNYGWKDLLAFGELFGVPIRLGRYTSEMTDDDKDTLWLALYKLGTDACALIHKDALVEFPSVPGSTSGKDSTVFERLLELCRVEITLLILGQLATSGEAGGFSKGQAQENVRWDVLDSDAEALERFVRRKMLTPLVRLNLGPEAPVPVFQFTREEPVDTRAMVETFTGAARLGVRVPRLWAQGKLGIPEPAEDEEVLEAPAALPAMGFAGTDVVGAAAGQKKKCRSGSPERLARFVC